MLTKAGRMPRIGFDARWIADCGTGVSVYAQQLLHSLLRIDAGVRYVLLFSAQQDRARAMDRLGDVPTERYESVVLSCAPTGAASQLSLPRTVRNLDLDVFHVPEFLVPLGLLYLRPRPAPAIVVTIHDVIPLTVPDACPRSQKSRLKPLYRFALAVTARRAEAVLTGSAASRNELTRLLGVPGHRVHVIADGVSPVFRPGAARCLSQQPVILYVGRQDPYKGLDTLVTAFAELRSRHRFDARLAIAGLPDKRYPEPSNLARSLGVNGSVDWLGFLSETELVTAYQRASVLVLPSKFEGFGLPVLEAMACGTPVVCSRAGALPEVAGEAAEYVEPGNPGQLCAALSRVLTDPGHAARLSRAGIERATQFTWKRAAERTLDVYQALLARRKDRA